MFLNSPWFYHFPLCLHTDHWTCSKNPKPPVYQTPSGSHKISLRTFLQTFKDTTVSKNYRKLYGPFPDRRTGQACWAGSRLNQWTGPPQRASSRSAWLHTDTKRWALCTKNSCTVKKQRFAGVTNNIEANYLLGVVPNVFIFNHSCEHFAGSSTDLSEQKEDILNLELKKAFREILRSEKGFVYFYPPYSWCSTV